MSATTGTSSGNVSTPFALSGSPVIYSEKLNGKNYLAWSAPELWFLGQGHYDHLEKSSNQIPEENRNNWEKIDYQLCALLWQSVESNILANFRSFKTYFTFWKKAQNVFANDIQRLYDSVQRLSSLEQSDHDMISYVSKAQSVIEEIKTFLEADSLAGIKAKLDNLYMVLILRGLHSDFDHVRDQILTGQEVPSLENLITRLLRVPSTKDGSNSNNSNESSAMISNRGGRVVLRGGRDGKSNRPQCSHCKRMGHTHDTCYSFHGFSKRSANVSKAEPNFSDNEYQEYLQLKAAKLPETSTATSTHNSTACISQSSNSQTSWIIDSDASDHIAGT